MGQSQSLNLPVPTPPPNSGRVFTSVDGKRKLYYETYTVTPPRALVVYLHGLHESLNITSLARIRAALNSVGISVVAFEQHGHGRSTGTHGQLLSLDVVLSDTLQFVRARVAEMPGNTPFALCGHSMGGALALILGNSIRAEFGARFLGVSLLSPFVKLHARDSIGAFDAAVLSLVASPTCMPLLGGLALGPTIATVSDFGAANVLEIKRYDSATLLMLDRATDSGTSSACVDSPATSSDPPVLRAANYTGNILLSTAAVFAELGVRVNRELPAVAFPFVVVQVCIVHAALIGTHLHRVGCPSSS